jgi:hypothetical protein
MQVEVISQCDAGPKALFPGQRYDLPDEIANELVVAGKVRIVGEPGKANVRGPRRK